MPTYQYACTECHDQFEVVQQFTDDALTECPHCSGRLRKVFSAVGVVFKGSGFYRTDSRTGSGGSSTVPSGGGSTKTESNGSSGSTGSTGSGDTSSTPSSSPAAKPSTSES